MKKTGSLLFIGTLAISLQAQILTITDAVRLGPGVSISVKGRETPKSSSMGGRAVEASQGRGSLSAAAALSFLIRTGLELLHSNRELVIPRRFEPRQQDRVRYILRTLSDLRLSTVQPVTLATATLSQAGMCLTFDSIRRFFPRP
ncbi:MAG: hypothetical protein SGJ20_17715 [Planctomycetota bacterium]|nr:hypothetical protein [Planctomycetota bacterium]